MNEAFEPRPGSVPDRVLAYLRNQPPGAELITSKLAEGIKAEPASLPTCLLPALEAGAIYRRQKDKTHVRAPFFWSLTDHSVQRNGVAAIAHAMTMQSAVTPAAIEAQLARARDNTAPAGRPALTGEHDDDEGDSGRARRVAGEGDDGRSGQRGQASGERPGRDDRRAEHDPGLLRAQHPGTAHQGDAERELIERAPWPSVPQAITRQLGQQKETLALRAAVPETTARVADSGDAQRADDRGQPKGEAPRAEVVAPSCAPPVAISATPDASNRHESSEGRTAADCVETFDKVMRFGRRPEEVPQAAPAAAPPLLRVALWSDGLLQIQRGADRFELDAHETRQLVAYLESVLIDREAAA